MKKISVCNRMKKRHLCVKCVNLLGRTFLQLSWQGSANRHKSCQRERESEGGPYGWVGPLATNQSWELLRRTTKPIRDAFFLFFYFHLCKLKSGYSTWNGLIHRKQKWNWDPYFVLNLFCLLFQSSTYLMYTISEKLIQLPTVVYICFSFCEMKYLEPR